MDLFEKDGKMFLVVVDYYSRFITTHILSDNSTSESLVKIREGLFCLLGVPNTIVSDNGPQFTVEVFRNILTR